MSKYDIKRPLLVRRSQKINQCDGKTPRLVLQVFRLRNSLVNLNRLVEPRNKIM
jgi:hypothetical protein